MTFAPATLTRLRDLWEAQGGTWLGIVGDAAHQRRASYHNGQDAIDKYGRTALDDYSIRLARDREPHLTNAASAVDLGRLGSLAGLQKFSNWLVAACIRDADVRHDIREIVYSPDGKTVQRYSGPDNLVRVGGTADHLWHTHISFYRDSEKREKVPLFAPYFALPDTAAEEPHDMAIETRGLTLLSHHFITLPDDTKVYESPVDGASVIGTYSGVVPYFGHTNGYKAVRVGGPDGSVIGYAKTAATVWDSPPPVVDTLAIRRAEYDRVKAGAKATATLSLPPRP